MNQLDKIIAVNQIWKRKSGKELVVAIETGSNEMDKKIKTYSFVNNKLFLVKYEKLTPNSWERNVEREIVSGKEYSEAVKIFNIYGGIN